MKTKTNTFRVKKECKHSIVFEPIGATVDQPAIASSIYIDRRHIPIGATECKITVSWPEGGQDTAYLNLK